MEQFVRPPNTEGGKDIYAQQEKYKGREKNEKR